MGVVDDDEEEDWACPSLAEVEADLVAIETKAAGDDVEKELRRLLKQRSGSQGGEADVFFSTDVALRGIAAELHGALVRVENLQCDAAALLVSSLQGPLKPPKAAPAQLQRLPSAEKLFGKAIGDAPPRALDAVAPAGASSMTEYRRLLAGLPRELLVNRPLRLCVGDINRKQDTKDIGRDRLDINGKVITGAEGGYDAAVEALQAALQAGAFGGDAQAAEAAARLLLSVLNRTSSGFAAFEEVLRLFNCLDVVVVSPDSAQAKPLEAAVLPGIALGRAHTRYSVRRADGAGEPLTVIDAVFTFRLPLQQLQRLASSAGSHDAWPAEDAQASILLMRCDAAAADNGVAHVPA
eukprot:TRINITY_DN45206_c0_g1_i2.p1 TRINITY_DN45206_c0_g1~~TRINITY_DN45206_c0_g1_i2.p1  ORF type:complete len:352 (-),score=113.40 TRINITY_DN45206_c0_g1_i2:41-1096(-)